MLARGDRRISFSDAIAPGDVIPRLRAYDFLAVPSQWLETGPLVALEAFAAGTPVIGWKLGGIAELVEHGRDGLLIEPSAATGWVDALQGLAGDRALRARLQAGVRQPRRSTEVARDMLALYASLLAPRATARPGTLSSDARTG